AVGDGVSLDVHSRRGARDDEEDRRGHGPCHDLVAAASIRAEGIQAVPRPAVSALGFLLDPEFLGRLWAIVLIDLLLAGDNALVIALAVRSLPRRQQLVGRIFGTAGAVLLRVGLIALATALLRIPLLQVTGGLLLLWVAAKLVRPINAPEAHTQSASSLAKAIWIIVVADAVMSLDNVLGVAGPRQGDMKLVAFRIMLS